MEHERSAFARLLFIDSEIARRVYPNAKTLAGAWKNVSERTIKRDIQWLRSVRNAPIEYDASRRGYYYAEESFRLPSVWIGAQELFAITLAGEVLRQYRNAPVYETLAGAFDKLGAMLPDRVSVDPGWLDRRIWAINDPVARIDFDVWNAVLMSLRDRRRLRVHYFPGNRKPAKSKDLDPYHLVAFRGDWYLIGYDHSESARRSVALSQVERSEPGDERFEVPEDFNPAEFVDPRFGVHHAGAARPVSVHFSAELAPHVLRKTWHATQKLDRHDDGTVTLRFDATELHQVRAWVLGWGAGCTVTEPAELVAAIRSELEEMRSGYEQTRR